MYLNLDSPPPSTAKKDNAALQHSRKAKGRHLSPDSPCTAGSLPTPTVIKNLAYALSTPAALPSESLESTEDFVYAELIVDGRGEECVSRALLRAFAERFNARNPDIMQVFAQECVFETRPGEMTPAFTAVAMLAEALTALEVDWTQVSFDASRLLLTGVGRYQRPDATTGQFQITCHLQQQQFDYIHLLL